MEDKTHLKSETAYFMMLQEGEEARVYLKDDVDAVIAEKDAEIAQLKSDIADLRDDKKTTDAILDECNAKIAELQDRLRASEKQNEDIINSASQIMILQDKALANKEGQR